MVTIGSKVKLDAIKEAIWKNEPIHIIEPKVKKVELTDADKIDLLECCYTWQSAYKKQIDQPKVGRTWARVEKIIKKLEGG